MKQLAKQERRHTRVNRQLNAIRSSNASAGRPELRSHEDLPPVVHHNLSKSSKNAINLAKFLSNGVDDPAVKVINFTITSVCPSTHRRLLELRLKTQKSPSFKSFGP